MTVKLRLRTALGWALLAAPTLFVAAGADDKVATQQQADQARRQRARADALYRRSMDSAAVGMCLADLEGNLIEVNAALCVFLASISG